MRFFPTGAPPAVSSRPAAGRPEPPPRRSGRPTADGPVPPPSPQPGTARNSTTDRPASVTVLPAAYGGSAAPGCSSLAVSTRSS